jgi:hypothetical protein
MTLRMYIPLIVFHAWDKDFALNKGAILKAKLSLFIIIYDDIKMSGEVQVQFHANFNFGILWK